MGSNPIDATRSSQSITTLLFCMIILGIETSCDETSLALLEISQRKGQLFLNPIKSIVTSQIKIHAPYGGVVPMLSAREHVKNLPIIFQRLARETYGSSKKLKTKVDLLAVTEGPGLIPALLMGVNFSRTLAWAWEKPILGINHLEGHLLSFLLPPKTENYQLSITNPEPHRVQGHKPHVVYGFQAIFPAICLLVSGGHTQLIYLKKISQYQVVGETLDDAAGECFDKGARILGLGYPGGPVIAAEAEKYQKQAAEGITTTIRIALPRPMLNSHNYDFSFSGLKTALLYSWQKLSPIEKNKLRPAFAFELQEAITDVLVAKTLKAAHKYQVSSIILGGGVTANQRLREKFQSVLKQNDKFNLFLPPLEYTTDNAMMIALAAFFHWQKQSLRFPKNSWQKVTAEANLRLS